MFGVPVVPHSSPSRSGVLTILAIVALIAGCASGPTVITNSAPDFNLADFQTFSFLEPLSTDDGNVRTLLSNELIDAARPELEFAGLRYVESGGDLLVNFALVTRETLQTRSTPTASMSMHRSRSRYSTWGGYSLSMSTVEVVQRTEGTIAVDLIDAAERQLVWEGSASGRVTDRKRDNRADAIADAIKQIFARFP